ncbi:acyl-CoA synthetase FdrA [Bacteroidota bacterium]
MVIKGLVKKGEYFDSVSLMILAKKLNEINDIHDSALVMGTKENKSILEASGYLLKEFSEAKETDLLIAVKSAKEEIADFALEKIDDHLHKLKISDDDDRDFSPMSIDNAVKVLPGANLVIISLPGKYAGDEAMKALRKGLHVLLFSDNVTLEKEIELKKFAVDNGLLMMGPDCGTAIINGVPLAFANVVNRGNIGIVAAAGTGLQEVSSIISNEGGGISQAIGTGGRDIKRAVGGLMFIKSLKALSKDESTDVILLVSKPPDQKVLEKIVNIVKDITKPVVAVFLKGKTEDEEVYDFYSAITLEEGALVAVALSKRQAVKDVTEKIIQREMELDEIAKVESQKIEKKQKYLRALYSGGTFCSEAQIIFSELSDEIYSNAPVEKSNKLSNAWQSEKHTIVDLGEDEFTVGKPHPMIDYSIRNKRIITEAEDTETAVILLDVVLGYGSNMNPLADILPVLTKAKSIAKENQRYLPIICSVTGTDKDPQIRSNVAEGLKQAGALVMESNAAACKLSYYIIKYLRE